MKTRLALFLFAALTSINVSAANYTLRMEAEGVKPITQPEGPGNDDANNPGNPPGPGTRACCVSM